MNQTGSKGPLKEEALVIRSIRHGETSRILTLFTRGKGRIAVIAKGARRGKSGASGGFIETANLIEALIYFKSSRSVQTLGQVSILKTYSGIKRNLILTGYAAATMELLNLSFTDAEPNSDAFDAATDMLDKLELNRGDPRVNLWFFQLSLLKVSGFALDAFSCPVCGAEKASVGVRNLFWLDTGAICCADCHPPSGTSIPLSGESVSLLRKLNGDNHDKTLSRLKPSRNARREISGALEKYMRYHNQSISKMPALKMLDEFENLVPKPVITMCEK